MSERLHYLDNTRALAMLLGILLHAALAYSPMSQPTWLTADSVNSAFFDVFFVAIHSFRMPLFFLISGYFALLLIEKQEIKGFLVNRLKRIFLPFIIFLPLVLLTSFGIVFWAIEHIDTNVPILDYMSNLSPSDSELEIGTLHLWFLLNLFYFCLLLAALMKVIPILMHRLFNLITVKILLILLPLMMVPTLLAVPFVPFPPADKLYPQWWSFGFFGLFFLVGCVFRKRTELLAELVHYQRITWLIGLTSLICFYFLLPEPMSTAAIISQINTGIPFSWQHLCLVSLEAIAAVHLSLALIVFAKQYLSNPNEVMKYFMDSAYWIYIIHIPVLFWFQFLIIDMSLNIWIKFILSNVVVLLIGAASYHYLVKNTWLGRLLNGDPVKGQTANQ